MVARPAEEAGIGLDSTFRTRSSPRIVRGKSGLTPTDSRSLWPRSVMLANADHPTAESGLPGLSFGKAAGMLSNQGWPEAVGSGTNLLPSEVNFTHACKIIGSHYRLLLRAPTVKAQRYYRLAVEAHGWSVRELYETGLVGWFSCAAAA